MQLSKTCFEAVYPQLSGEDAFVHYEHVRKRLPTSSFGQNSEHSDGLLSIADHFDVFVFDAYGVLNIGGTPIAGARKAIDALRALGKQIFVLSNGASYDVVSNQVKFTGLGFEFDRSELISSRMAAERALFEQDQNIVWGVVGKANYSPQEFEQKTIRLTDNPAQFDEVDGFLYLSTLDWNADRQQLLEQSVKSQLRPVIIANPDVVSPRETHFGIEPGYLGHRLAELYDAKVQFFGKPFGSVFDIISERLPSTQDRKRICMIGDTLHTDILGGAAKGWSTVLVTGHGMFKGLDVQDYINRSGIVPDWIIPSI